MATPAKLCFFAVIFGFFQLVSGIIYVDNILCEPNKAVLDITVVTAHDATGNALTNLTFKTRSVVTKMLLYLKVIMADDQIKAGVTREVLRSVVDIEKVMKGSHSNPLIKQFFDSLLPKMNFTISFPFQPGTYVIWNVIVDTSLLPLLQDTSGTLDFRVVGKFGGGGTMKYMAHLAFSGGFRRG